MTAPVVSLLPHPQMDEAVEEFLARPQLDADTIRSYRQALGRLVTDLGAHTALGTVSPELVSEIFTRAWAHLSARTWNRHRSAVRSFTTWAAGRWPIADLPALIERRKESTDKTKAIARHRITALLARRDVALREKTFWQLAYESAARAHELLGLDIADLDQANKRARVVRKGGDVAFIFWQSGTARLLPRLLAGRRAGPLFLTDRKPGPARTPASADLCPDTGRARLSYQRAELLFKQASRLHDPVGQGFTLHQLRHSRLTHLGEDGWSAPMLMALSGHESLRTLGIYVNPSPEAVAAALAAQDPGRRHR